ncbi:MAG TPA: hypothetical protein V6C57_08505 [Coleofasciculaceae cyanobacterium]
MVIPRSWQSGAALTMTMTIASSLIVPLMWLKPAVASTESILMAQTFPDSWRRSVLPAGTLIPVRYDKAEKIILKPDETVPVTLTVTRDILTARGTVAIPEGSQIAGELRPVEGGTQFVAKTLILQNGGTQSPTNQSPTNQGTSNQGSSNQGSSNQGMPIDAVSSPITRTETITKRSNPNILRGAAIGAGAAAILSEIFGKINPLEVIGGAGLGVLAEVLLRGHQEVQVIVVEPATDIDLRLQSDFTLN